jgi:arginine/serine-rich splicing factor 4/5/6
MARRLYLGHLSPDARSEDVQKLFDGYGNVVDCRVMTGKGPSTANDRISTPIPNF